MFEQFLKSGDYLLGKKRTRPQEYSDINPEEMEALDFDGLVFGKRSKFDDEQFKALLK